MMDNRKAKKLLKDLNKAKFDGLVDDPDALHDWIKRQGLIPHTRDCVIRFTMAGTEGDWYLWVVYKFVDGRHDHVTFQLDGLFGPDDTEHNLLTPEPLRNRDFYAA
jgi:hypothetical protein